MSYPGRKTKVVLARCANFNGHKDVLFMATADDFRLQDAPTGKWASDPRSWEILSAGWTRVADATFDMDSRTLTANGATYRVFPDWSLRKVA